MTDDVQGMVCNTILGESLLREVHHVGGDNVERVFGRLATEVGEVADVAATDIKDKLTAEISS